MTLPQEEIRQDPRKTMSSTRAGRFTRKDISERKCILCNSGAIEDEQHFICNCTLYDDFRINFFNYAGKCMPGFLLRTEEDKLDVVKHKGTNPHDHKK